MGRPSKLANEISKAARNEAIRKLCAMYQDDYDRLRREASDRLKAISGYTDGRKTEERRARLRVEAQQSGNLRNRKQHEGSSGTGSGEDNRLGDVG